MITVDFASCLNWLEVYEGPLFDSCVTDPPYEIGFMNKKWDSSGVSFRPETWAAVYDKLKPGAHLVAFGGTRTYHRMACAIEDAGFEIRDQLAWCYGSGFPKSHDISKAIDKDKGIGVVNAGAAHEQNIKRSFSRHYDRADKGNTITANAVSWQGWGTAIKPAWEPICLARKPLSEKTVAANVLKWGTGALNIDGCRVGVTGAARWPANICHDGSDVILAGFPSDKGRPGNGLRLTKRSGAQGVVGLTRKGVYTSRHFDDDGNCARFFYSAKAGPLDRIGSAHATVKPVDLMRWLCRMVTPAGGLILEPFAGSGTTGIAAMAEGFSCRMIDIEAEHVADIERKLAYLCGEGGLSMLEKHKARLDRVKPSDIGGLFTDQGHQP